MTVSVPIRDSVRNDRVEDFQAILAVLEHLVEVTTGTSEMENVIDIPQVSIYLKPELGGKALPNGHIVKRKD